MTVLADETSPLQLEQSPENATREPCPRCGHRQHTASFTGHRVGRADPGTVQPYRSGGPWETCDCASCRTEPPADVRDVHRVLLVEEER